MSNIINPEVLARKQEFAARKAKQQQEQQQRSVMLQAKEVAYAGVKDNEPVKALQYVFHSDSTLSRALARGIQFAAGRQLFGYLKVDPDELPIMSVGEIQSIEQECHIDLLAPTMQFMGVDSLRELGAPKRQMIKAGVDGAAFELLSYAILSLNNNRKHRGEDAFLAQMLNRVVGSTLDFELPQAPSTIYDWDANPAGTEDLLDERMEERNDDSVEQDNGQAYAWG